MLGGLREIVDVEECRERYAGCGRQAGSSMRLGKGQVQVAGWWW